MYQNTSRADTIKCLRKWPQQSSRGKQASTMQEQSVVVFWKDSEQLIGLFPQLEGKFVGSNRIWENQQMQFVVVASSPLQKW